eukprot:6479781-Amphidinium_carterae.1
MAPLGAGLPTGRQHQRTSQFSMPRSSLGQRHHVQHTSSKRGATVHRTKVLKRFLSIDTVCQGSREVDLNACAINSAKTSYNLRRKWITT